MKATRQDMLRDIEAEVRYTREQIGRQAFATRVMQAMGEVPREKFVPPNMQGAAFENGPLPIGHGQTISQPYIVALMTDLLEPETDHRILEIGTGCGYQTAILSRLCATVYTVEVVGALGEAAADRLQTLGYRNIEFLIGNGYAGPG
jgi:protein-L-isoaspartate(D-aspartate) O-methyltransferase